MQKEIHLNLRKLDAIDSNCAGGCKTKNDSNSETFSKQKRLPKRLQKNILICAYGPDKSLSVLLVHKRCSLNRRDGYQSNEVEAALRKQKQIQIRSECRIKSYGGRHIAINSHHSPLWHCALEIWGELRLDSLRQQEAAVAGNSQNTDELTGFSFLVRTKFFCVKPRPNVGGVRKPVFY